MEVILALNGALQSAPCSQPNQSKVISNKWTAGGFSCEYEWTLSCEPKVILKDAVDVNMNMVKDIENIRGNVQLEMAVISYPDDYQHEPIRGEAYATMYIRDTERVLETVLDLVPRNCHVLFVELKYNNFVLNFSNLSFNHGVAEPTDSKDWIRLSTHRVMELMSDEIEEGTEFKATICLQFKDQ